MRRLTLVMRATVDLEESALFGTARWLWSAVNRKSEIPPPAAEALEKVVGGLERSVALGAEPAPQEWAAMSADIENALVTLAAL